MKLEQIKNKRIAIWGFGVEGKATAKYLTEKAIKFDILAKAEEAMGDFSFVSSEVDIPLLNEYDIIIKSPGISPYQDLVQEAKVEFTSSTALWFNNEKKVPVIAISGTKGKSTSSSLLAHVLVDAGFKVSLVGNIGDALLLCDQNCDFVIMECSSYQIYDGDIKADIALLTNLFPEHLDWHLSIENYFNDKIKLFNNSQKNIINYTNKFLSVKTQEFEVRYFNHPAGFWVHNQALFYQDELVLKLKDIQLIGEHNLENIAAVFSICNYIGVNLQTAISSVLHFVPLAHRLQSLGKIGKHFAINDSISSTPFATIAALKTQDCAKTTVLIGGYNRGIDWTDFFEYIDHNPPFAIILSGKNADNLFAQYEKYNFKTRQNLIKLQTLKQAIETAKNISEDNVTILLSPGSPSFDAFKNYIERGIFFENELKK